MLLSKTDKLLSLKMMKGSLVGGKAILATDRNMREYGSRTRILELMGWIETAHASSQAPKLSLPTIGTD